MRAAFIAAAHYRSRYLQYFTISAPAEEAAAWPPISCFLPWARKRCRGRQQHEEPGYAH